MKWIGTDLDICEKANVKEKVWVCLLILPFREQVICKFGCGFRRIPDPPVCDLYFLN